MLGKNVNDPKYFKSIGVLKDGYSFDGNAAGAQEVGKYITVGGNVGKPSIGTNKRVGGTNKTIYKLAPPKAASAPAPAPAAPAPAAPKPEEPKEPSAKLQEANNLLNSYTKSGSNFQANTQAERKEVTDSFKQTPAYDPNAGIASEEAGNFLNDYKLNLKNQINSFKTIPTSNLNPNPNGGE
jgi:hypothetical protein